MDYENSGQLDEQTQATIAWSICAINAFCMMCAGLTIDMQALLAYLRAHVRWQILVGLSCQMMVMPLVALMFTPMLDEAQSFAVLIQGTCPGSAIAMLFSAWCHGNPKVVQSMASLGTLSAIVLIPLWMSIFHAQYKPPEGTDGIQVPYWPIVRTLLILISALLVGMSVKYFALQASKEERFPRWVKKFSKMGTILSIFVIFTFVVFGVLFYEGQWWPGLEMSLCAMFIPLIGFIMGFLFAAGGKFLLSTLVQRQVKWIEPKAVMDYDWSEVRSIALACGLQNTQFAMSSIFGAFHQQEFVTRIPMYGVFSMTYAFIFSVIWRVYEAYRYRKYKDMPADGPRIPEFNIEDYDNPAIRQQKKTNDQIYNVLARKLPKSLMDTLKGADVDDHDTIESVHRTVQRTLEKIDKEDLNETEYRNLKAFTQAMDIYHKRMSLPTPAENTTVHKRNLENRITEVQEEDTESIKDTSVKGRFSVKKARTSWQKLAAKLSSDKYKTAETQKTVETFLNDEDDEAIETAEEVGSRLQKVVVQAQVEEQKKRNRFSIKSVSSVEKKASEKPAVASIPDEDIQKEIESSVVIKVPDNNDAVPDVPTTSVPNIPISDAVTVNSETPKAKPVKNSRFVIVMTDLSKEKEENRNKHEQEDEVFC